MLEINNLVFNYHDIDNSNLLNKISFIVKCGELLYLRGNNGIGKTTLLKLIAGLLDIYGGEIIFNQQSIYKNLALYQQQICLIGHKPGFSQLLTVRENLKFIINKNNNIDQYELNQYLMQLNLLEIADVKCSQLSSGQFKRLNIIRLMLTKAKLWLLDEPFVALDANILAVFTNIIKNFLANDGLIILTSHQKIADFKFTEYYLC